MPRGDNLSQEDRSQGGKNSRGGNNGQEGSQNKNQGGDTSNRGLASADKETRQRVAREGGKSSK